MYCRKPVLCLAALVLLTTFANAQKKQWPQTFLWHISGNGLTKPSVMYGTIHLTDKKLFNFGDSLYHYLEQAEGFNIEIDADSMVAASVKRWTEKDNGKMLKDLMKKHEYDKYASKLSKTLNKPADQVTTNDIWKLKNRRMASEAQKGDMSNFMDLYFYSIAKKQGKIVGGIEDLQDQLTLLDEGFKDTDLQYVLTDSLEDGFGLKLLKGIYIQENLSGVDSLFMGIKDESYRDKLLTKRNLKMAVRMDSIAKLRSTFFAIGVAHLPGDSGLIQLLRQRGFTVEPVFSKKKLAASNYKFKEVETNWLPFTHSTNLYSVNLPGTPQPMDAFKQVMDMQYYFDIPTATTYFTAFVQTLIEPNKKDSLFNEMIKKMTKEGKVISKKNIVKQGYEGREALIKSVEGDAIRMNLFFAEDIIYMVFATNKKEAKLGDAETQSFFKSFSMSPKKSVVKPYELFRDTTAAYSVLLPSNTVLQEEPTTADKGFEKQVVATDYGSGINFVVSVSNVKPGSYYASDMNYIEEVKQNLGATMKDDAIIKDTTVAGMPALVVSGTGKNEPTYFKVITVLRGNRSYVLVSASKLADAHHPLIDTFFSSFKLLDYSRTPWNKYLSPDSSFTVWLPAPFLPIDSPAQNMEDTAILEAEAVNAFLSYDNSTSTSYHIQRAYFDEYFSITNDSTFFTEHAEAFMDEGDSIFTVKPLSIGIHKAADIVMKNEASSLTKKFRFLLIGDTLYKVFTFSPKWVMDDNNHQFFNQFALTSAAPASTLFTDKTAQWVTDIQSADSASFTKASDYLYNAAFSKSSLPQLHPLLIKPLRDFDDSLYTNSNDQLVDALVKIADSTTVDFVLQHYTNLQGKQAELQYPLLRLLVEMNDPYANEAAAKLLAAANGPGGDAAGFSRALSDNLPFAKSVFPRLLSFTQDTNAALEYAHIMVTLIDSSIISKETIAGSLKNFVAASTLQKKKLVNNDDDYDYGLMSILNLFAAIDNAESRTQLQSFSKVENMQIKHYATRLLLENNLPVAYETLLQLAATDQYRSLLYEALEKAGKTNLFPATYRNQKQMAASYVFNYAWDDYLPQKVEYVAEKTVNYKGTMQKFYLYKVIFDPDEDMEPSLAIAGPFATDKSKATSNNEATGVYWQEPFTLKKVNEQFIAFLKQLERGEEEED